MEGHDCLAPGEWFGGDTFQACQHTEGKWMEEDVMDTTVMHKRWMRYFTWWNLVWPLVTTVFSMAVFDGC